MTRITKAVALFAALAAFTLTGVSMAKSGPGDENATLVDELTLIVEREVSRIEEAAVGGGCPAPPPAQSGYQAAVSSYADYAELLAILDSVDWLITSDPIAGTDCYLFGYCNALDSNSACFEGASGRRMRSGTFEKE